MNVFILSTGRCGSTTFIRACHHISNYTSGHESRWGQVGSARLAYPDRHIESDNRLSWFLGRLEKAYGNDAFYVHLRRNLADTVLSFSARYNRGIVNAYRQAILVRDADPAEAAEISADYYDTVNCNIEAFLKDKTAKMTIALESAKDGFPEFWRLIEAEGDLEAALSEWDTRHNASTRHASDRPSHVVARVAGKLKRMARTLTGRAGN
jgi:hypothetical protein